MMPKKLDKNYTFFLRLRRAGYRRPCVECSCLGELIGACGGHGGASAVQFSAPVANYSLLQCSRAMSRTLAAFRLAHTGSQCTCDCENTPNTCILVAPLTLIS